MNDLNLGGPYDFSFDIEHRVIMSFYVNYDCPFDCVKFIVKLISVNALATAHCVLLQDYCITK